MDTKSAPGLYLFAYQTSFDDSLLQQKLTDLGGLQLLSNVWVIPFGSADIYAQLYPWKFDADDGLVFARLIPGGHIGGRSVCASDPAVRELFSRFGADGDGLTPSAEMK